MRFLFRQGIRAAILAVLALALTACGPGYKQGPAGVVADKTRHLSCHYTGANKRRQQTCDWKYWLTTRDTAKAEHEFRVGSRTYRHCVRGAAYPKCGKEDS